MGMFDWLSPTAGADQGNMGLMGMLANPQTAGLLGMAGGLLQASGPSRLPVSNGMALGSGFQGMQQGMQNAIQNQRAMLTMQALQGAMSPQQQASGPQGAPVAGAANTGPMSGVSAGMGSYAGYGGAPSGSSGAGATAGPSIFGNTPQQLWQQGKALSLAGFPAGAEMMKMAAQYDPTLQAALPTDITKMGMQGGMSQADIQAANRAGVQKANYIAPTALRTPIYFDPTTGTTKVVDPSQLAAGYGAQYGAEARAQAGFKPMQVWDPSANGGQGGFVFQTAANVSDAASGGQAPVGIRNNNFGNIKGANGQFQTFDTPQDGVNAADQLLATYGSKHGINTIAGIANRWAPAGDGSNNPAAKAEAMAAASGVPANQPINLADPNMRARILPALFDTETPGWRNALQSGAPRAQAPAQGSPMAAQPPMGAQNAANSSQGAPSKQMADAYGALSGADSAYQQSREALTSMIGLANQKGAGGAVVGVLPETVGTKISPDAAEYQKLHSTFVALQGKALGSSGTDAARATIDEAVPTYDKPQSAMVSGLNTQLNNLDLNHLKTQFLTPTYQAGNEKQYTQLSAAFDQNIKPSMMPVLQMSGDQQRAAVQAAIKANPALRPNFEWAFNHGMLK